MGYGDDLELRITDTGRELLDRVGLALPPRRKAIRYCIDWTEQRHHLSGGLGAALLTTMLDRDWLSRADPDRAVLVTDLGRVELRHWFDIDTAAILGS